MSEEADSSPLILAVTVGMFEGSLIGAMANTVPMQVVIVMAMMVSLVIWRAQRVSFFVFTVLLSGVVGGAFGSLGQIIPWGFTEFMMIQLVVYFWRSGSFGLPGGGGLVSMIAIPFYIMISVGIFYNGAYPDFCFQQVTGGHIDVCANPGQWVNGFPTIWAGCVSTCSITSFSIFGSSIFSNFISSAAQGDYVGMITGLFTGSQTGLGGILGFISTILTFTIGLVLVLLGLGIGFNASALASGFGIQINEAGTRFAQSFGVGLIMWSLVFGGFQGWFSAFGTGFTWGSVFGTSLIIFFATMVFYGYYIQGKNIGT